ncbi:MAG: DNA methyltransferase, partial [Desulfotomaculales bacterium]
GEHFIHFHTKQAHYNIYITKIVSVKHLKPLNLRPIVESRVSFLRESITKNGYDPACPLIVQPNNGSYLVVNGCHRLAALSGLDAEKVPVVEYPPDEDQVQLALRTQENDESVQPWDFLDRAYLVKKLYEELGTQERVAERLGWAKSHVSYHLQIANLPNELFSVIRNSVNNGKKDTENDVVLRGERQNLENYWKFKWFRHICALPREDLKFEAVSEIAQDPAKWKESDVKSWYATAKLRYDLNKKVAAVFLSDQNAETTDVLPDAVSQVPEQYQELVEKIWSGTFDKQQEKAVERAQAVLKSIQLTDLELMGDCGYEPQVYTIWKFNGRDERFGVEHPGNIPAGILFNVLYFWTEQGDLVIDPMAGGGVTIDVCKSMRRKCLAWDVAPVRGDIEKGNALDPWPVEPESASLVFLDPPYWKQKRGEYRGENNLADMALAAFYEAMKAVFERSFAALRSGGHIAVIVGPTQEKGIVHDHALKFAELLAETGFSYVNRIIVPYTTQQVQGFDVAQAKKGKYLLKLHRDLLVYRKVSERHGVCEEK